MSCSLVGTSPFVSPKSVEVWYFGVPSSLKAPIEKMNGPAPPAVSGKPASAVAVVVTFQVVIPSAPRNEFRCGDWIVTWTATPLLVSMSTPTEVDAAAVGVVVRRGDRSGPGPIAWDELLLTQVVVRRGEGGQIGRALLVAPLGIGSAAVDREADDPDDRDHGEDEHDEDLAAPGPAAGSMARHGAPSDHWILALLAVVKVMVPKALRSGRIGWKEVRTETFTQFAGLAGAGDAGAGDVDAGVGGHAQPRHEGPLAGDGARRLGSFRRASRCPDGRS